MRPVGIYRLVLFGLASILVVDSAMGKEKHLDQVRVLLISKAARCTSCHVDDAGKSLNVYGREIAKMPADDPLADRIAAVEAEPEVVAGESADAASRRRDVDRDGVLNWIEILAGTNPADDGDKPSPKRVERIEAVVSCALCHTATGLPGEGLAANPHNVYGELLAKTFQRRRGRRAPAGEEAKRSAAERTPILTRVTLVRKKRPRKSKATYWQKIRMLHAPAEAADMPKADALKAFKKQVARQKRRRSRDATLGLACEAHAADGFLLDADGLE